MLIVLSNGKSQQSDKLKTVVVMVVLPLIALLLAAILCLLFGIEITPM